LRGTHADTYMAWPVLAKVAGRHGTMIRSRCMVPPLRLPGQPAACRITHRLRPAPL